ncbi:Serine/threonine-protein kinase PrkC [Gemmata obscuriglobus]|uniref:Protein kinase domain-containing protein n=1 Tax=Gemmata obscuriglobus TaxID=114 RepID=A0A2Z3GU13_9BACT|nr:serine/threonine-protein kinase [Gemmata obscuriglobus]AWM37253.1 hypothetical protein C1280_09595 [Gemmata obscuriglobus]QEG30005.1 Serine/threonine-protein kinase PrkC [Gemmata obscuriglobus]VTS09323.1 serine threonine protein kinase : Uncultured bacterium genome assembly Metasoil_fosmids_resub OS=uncultured bacterium PE=4 SV=1: Pkinase [Gemmata obscuriglobus UQM 2246]
MSRIIRRWPQQAHACPVPAEPVSTLPPPDETAERTLFSVPTGAGTRARAPVTFPGYEILDELGRGGMGVVYKARHLGLNRLVALKVILGGPLARDEDKARFRIEAEAGARLHHPNIVQVYDVGECAGFAYMALELVEGGTLRQWQNGHPVAARDAARLASAVARAIHHAHERGIIHRDLKPANILLAQVAGSGAGPGNSDGTDGLQLPNVRPKVTDFGLAKALAGGTDLTGTGVLCGTPNYMAPEQVSGAPPGPSVDVYGLGALLFEMLAGRPPFAGSDAADVLNQILRTEAPDVRRLAPRAPRDLAVIVAKCLEKVPARRYATARDLADDLDRYLGAKPIAARPVGPAGRAWRWSRRHPVAAGFLLISSAGCLLTGGMALELLHSRNGERAARDTADAARREAEEQRAAAERTRDELARALAAAEREQATALAEHAAAVKQQGHADAARNQSEADLRVAGRVICDAVRELAREPRFADDELRGTRLLLLESGRAFCTSVLAGKSDTPEWLQMLADVSHWLGYLEARNDNHAGAAAEYGAAADAAGRWARKEPANPDARGRRCESLMCAAGALASLGRLDEAERAYREAAGLIEGVVAERAKLRHPLEGAERRRARELYDRWARLLHRRGNRADCERAARKALDHARELPTTGPAGGEHLRLVQLAHQGYAHALGALGRWDEGERQFAAALEVADRHPVLGPRDAPYSAARVGGLLELADYRHARNHPARADEAFREAVGTMERSFAAQPADAPDSWLSVELARACIRHANSLRARELTADAEKRYNQALGALAPVLRRAPGFRPAVDAASDARAGRAELYDRTGRHRASANEWAALADEDPRVRNRSRWELNGLHARLRAGDWRGAYDAGLCALGKRQPGWASAEQGLVWCLVAKQIGADPALSPEDRAVAAREAADNAVRCLEAARSAGEFENPGRLEWYAARAADFAPVRDRFDPKRR